MGRLLNGTVLVPLAIIGGLLMQPMGVLPPVQPVACVLSAVACENQLTGNPATEWDVEDGGSPNILGFTTDISVNVGATVRFKIKTTASAYSIDIYRMGYYQGNGARKITSISPSVSLPQSQPACLNDATTGLVDCGNWAQSASWNVPSTAVSGVYFARIRRNDTGEANHIVFIVRNDASHSDVVFQTSDTTWQAYNKYGGSNFYSGPPVGRAYKLSYNRPFTTRSDVPWGRDWVFANEYPMIRWMERNGYDMSYIAGIDTDRAGSLLTNHKLFVSTGHDEYWSNQQRLNVEAARDAGLNLAFFSGNEVYWKTRYENSIDGTATNYRTLVTYKETWDNAKSDPSPEWTGTWRDPRFSPPANGGRPENALTGTMYQANCCNTAIKVPSADGKMRFWRNTSVATLAAGATATLQDQTLGYEYDNAVDNGFQPAGLIKLSTTDTVSDEKLLDYGNTVGTGPVTHNLTLYRAPSGALVFGAGTVQWSWGLDEAHDGAETAQDVNMQQATLNLFADMNVQPTTRQANLVAATKTTDTTAPTAAFTAPAPNATLTGGTNVTISGTATDTGGQVGGVEVSTDNGSTWHPATGRGSWTYTWSVNAFGPTTIKVRATDDSGNIQSTPTAMTVNVNCPCTGFGANTPVTTTQNDDSAVTLGVKFQTDRSATVTGVRFYKGAGNGGTHTGSLWDENGTRLATGTFTGETASGWQTLTFATPVAVSGYTTYTASYYAPQGHYAADLNFFNGRSVGYSPVSLLADGIDGPNGVYGVGDSRPTNGYGATNYGVDVVVSAPAGPDTTPPVPSPTSPPANSPVVPVASPIVTTFSEPVQAATISMTLKKGATTVAGTTAYDSGTRRATFTPSAAMDYDSTYTVTVSGAKDTVGNTMPSPVSWSFHTALAPRAAGVCPCSVFQDSDTPVVAATNDPASIEVGMRFRADADGSITGIRFFKGTGNSGTHIGSLWTNTGTKLASVTFTAEMATGWQQANLTTPVTVTAGQTYVVSYFAPNGRYSSTGGGFTNAVDRAPLHGLANAADGLNGVYSYGSSSTFPTSAYGNTNYWVDVVYQVLPDTTAPTVVTSSPSSGAPIAPVNSPVAVGFSEPLQAGTAVVTLTGPGGAVAGTTTYDAATKTATLTPTANLAYATTYTVNVSGAKDPAGNTMSPVSWSFTTALAPRAAGVCPCSVFADDWVPTTLSNADSASVELGMRFRSDVNGTATGIRFFKGTGNTGTHVGNLWSNTGTLLATVTFGGETATGWQQANLSTPVNLVAGTTYVVSYLAPAGHYSSVGGQFQSAVDRAPLHGLANGVDGPNGVYLYTATGGFPTNTYEAGGYAVDVVFQPAPDVTPPTAGGFSPPSGTTIAPVAGPVTATFSEDVQAATIVVGVTGPGGAVAGTKTYDSASRTVSWTPTANLAYGTAYTVTISGAKDIAGNTMSTTSWSFTTVAAPPPPGSCPCSLFAASAVPATPSANDAGPIEVGMRFRADQAGTVSAIRFYKGAGNTGTHVGHLWSNTGTNLATVTFTNELASGWQQANLSTPVAIAAGTTYVVSYLAPNGHYGVSLGQFNSTVDNGPLHGLANGVDGPNGTYLYAAGGGFPTGTYGNSGYWVDVVYQPNADTAAPTLTSRTPGVSATNEPVGTTVSATFSEAVQPATIVATLSGPGGSVAGTTAYDAATQKVTFTPSAALATATTYTATVSGAKDTAGNTMSPASWTFSTVGTCPCSLFASDALPAVTSTNDNGPLTVGTRFTPSVNGTVSAIRFYKGAGNTGTHVGTLWAPDGTALATVTFTGETAEGWQSATLTTPVALTAGTIYTVSYFAPNGHYASNNGFFNVALSSGPLQGQMGLFNYGSAPARPTDSYGNSNYWVDVVFSPGP